VGSVVICASESEEKVWGGFIVTAKVRSAR
jgi:hypothetical protein